MIRVKDPEVSIKFYEEIMGKLRCRNIEIEDSTDKKWRYEIAAYYGELVQWLQLVLSGISQGCPIKYVQWRKPDSRQRRCA